MHSAGGTIIAGGAVLVLLRLFSGSGIFRLFGVEKELFEVYIGKARLELIFPGAGVGLLKLEFARDRTIVTIGDQVVSQPGPTVRVVSYALGSCVCERFCLESEIGGDKSGRCSTRPRARL